MSTERVVQPPTEDQIALLLGLVWDTAQERHLQQLVVHIQRLRAAHRIQRAWRNFHCDWPGIQLDFKEFSRKQRLKRRIASQALTLNYTAEGQHPQTFDFTLAYNDVWAVPETEKVFRQPRWQCHFKK